MYLLFAYDRYYPRGAALDFVCKYATMKECLDLVKVNNAFNYMNIYDVEGDEWHMFEWVEWSDMSVTMYYKMEEDDDWTAFESVDELVSTILGGQDGDKDIKKSPTKLFII